MSINSPSMKKVLRAVNQADLIIVKFPNVVIEAIVYKESP